MNWTRDKLAALVGPACCTALLIVVPLLEGTVLKGYKDPIGIVTACNGHTETAELGRPYTPEECDKLLVQDLGEHAQGVLDCVPVPLTAGQRAAFISFAFNVGVRKFCESTMAALANAGDMIGACAQLSRWVRAGKRVMKGLVRRREIERAMCEGRTQ